MTRPNVLIIKSDQHNARCLGVNGHRQVRTPHLDALASRGVNFTRAFVQNPICTPSRMCYLTGQYVHNHGIFGLSGNERVPDGLPSLFSTFKSAGYRTGIVGHIHVDGSWLQPHCDLYRDLHDEARPGDTPYDRYLAGKGLQHLRDDEAYRGRSQILDACPSELAFEDTNEGYCLQSFYDLLEGTADGQPFLFQLDPLHPHQDYIPAREFWERYDGMELELPPSADEDLSAKPPHQQRMIARHHGYDWVFEPRTYRAGRLRKLQGYYGCISQVDHMVGLALQRLEQMGRAENTIVVYCSDHGDFALEHGFLEKAPGISYDAITRVPFIWSWPAGGIAENLTVEELVESVDLFPTLCALAGIDAPDTIDGHELVSLLRGGGAAVREFAVTECPAEQDDPHEGVETVPPAARCVRRRGRRGRAVPRRGGSLGGGQPLRRSGVPGDPRAPAPVAVRLDPAHHALRQHVAPSTARRRRQGHLGRLAHTARRGAGVLSVRRRGAAVTGTRPPAATPR